MINVPSRPTIALAALATLAATPASAEPFTYQGQLNEAGAPASGIYDFHFQLFDAPAGGSQIGPTLLFNDVAVTDGIFTVDPDFGDVFNEDDAYLFIQVREGASSGRYTDLLPRSPITAAPKAQYATTAGTVLNPQWTEAPGVLTYGAGTDRVFINRTNAITSAEVFGVHSDIPGFVGMYVSGPASSRPFYGYSVDGAVTAYTFIDGSENWVLANSSGIGTLRVTPEGDTFILGEATADSFNYSAPKTSYASVMGDSFHAASDAPFRASAGNGNAYLLVSGSGTMVAPIQLPHGAIVTNVRFYFNDTFSGGNLSFTLTRRTHGSAGFTFMAIVDTAGFNGNYLFNEESFISSPVINNDLYSYQLRVFSSNWSANSQLSIQSVVVEYTTSEAD